MDEVRLIRKDELMHYGVKGMKWGHRKNPEKAAGKAAKKYKKLATKARDELNRNYNNRYMNAYNKTADDMNNGGIDKYNSDYAKKLGSKAKNHDYANDAAYMKGYNDLFSKRFVEHYNNALVSEITNNKNYRKAKELCDKYNLEKYDDFVRKSEAEITAMRK